MPEEPKRYVSLCECSLNDHGDRNIAIVVVLFVIAAFTLYGVARYQEVKAWEKCDSCLHSKS